MIDILTQIYILKLDIWGAPFVFLYVLMQNSSTAKIS